MGLFSRLGRSDEELLTEEVLGWASSVPGTTRLAECPRRERVRVAGVVRRLTIRPADGALDAEIWDGTGDVTASWTGRSQIPGLALGTQMVLEGVISRERDRPKMVNPTYEFVSR